MKRYYMSYVMSSMLYAAKLILWGLLCKNEHKFEDLTCSNKRPSGNSLQTPLVGFGIGREMDAS